jgi:hypothetical protein
MKQEKIITPTIEKMLLEKRKRVSGQFIKGPIPLVWMCEVCKLSKNAIKAALAICFLKGILGDDWIELKNNLVVKFKLNRSGKSIGLRELEIFGLIKIKRRRGKSPLVKIIEAG